MNIGRFCLLLMAAILLLSPSFTFGITLGQVDTFEDGTAQGWLLGPHTGTTAANGGGPAGSGDHYFSFVQPTASGLAPIQVLNQSQWSGNYIGANVTSIEMDLKNANFPGDRALPIRIAIRESTDLAIKAGYCSAIAFNLPNDNQWHHASFSLAAVSMTGLNGPQPLVSDLSNVIVFGIISSASQSTIGDVALGSFFVDNIRSVPEPSSVSILLSGIIGIALLRRHRVFFRACFRSTHADGEFAFS